MRLLLTLIESVIGIGAIAALVAFVAVNLAPDSLSAFNGLLGAVERLSSAALLSN